MRDAKRQSDGLLDENRMTFHTSGAESRKIRLSRQVPPLPLDLLLLFVKIAELGSIAPASGLVGVSASYASRKLQDMERVLGVRLFERSTRSLRLTEAGVITLQWARETLSGYDALSDALDANLGKPTGHLRLAVNRYVASAYLPAILERYSQRYPEVSIEIWTTDRSVDLIAEGLDVAIYSGPNVPDDYVGVQIGSHRRIICASPAYIERFGEPKEPGDLHSHRILVHGTAESLSWGFGCDGKTEIVTIHPYVTADTHLMLRDLARRGMGIARLGQLLVEAELRSGGLREILGDYQSIYETETHVPSIWVLYPNKQLPFRIRAFVDLAVALLNDREHLV